MIRIQKLNASHANQMAEWMKSAELREALGIHKPLTLATTQSWLAELEKDSARNGFAILADQTHVGNLVFDRWDPVLKTMRLHIYLPEALARGKGTGAAALKLGLKTVFVERELYKVWLTVHEQNAAALALYSKLGFKKEGVHRGEFLIGGKRTDLVYMGLLAKEFR